MTVAPIADRTCLRCGYDLRGLPAARCPECGLPFDPDAPPPPAIPWVRRRELGIVSAYVRTVLMVVWRPKRFAEQAWRWTDVKVEDGERFRLLTVAVAAIAFAAAMFAGNAISSYARPWADHWFDLRVGIMTLTGAATFLYIATLRVPIAFPQAREGFQARFAALQKYCCAGLGLMVVVTATAIAFAILQRMDASNTLTGVTFILFAGSLLAVLVGWCGGCAMYLTFAGRVGFKTWLTALWMSAWLWIAAGLATFIVFLAEQAILSVLGL